MTEQVPDSILYANKRWTIEEWDGPTSCIPDSAALGFETTMRSTADWSGRVNHFLVHRNQLHLFKIQVNLPADLKDLIPAGARREIVIYSHGTGLRAREEYRYFVYDDLVIPFTGRLFLGYPYFDEWNTPWPVHSSALDVTERAVAQFEEGRLVEWTLRPCP